MMRVLTLFALFAFATAGKKANRKSRGRTVMPSPDQYMVEGQTLVQPGGVFEINGVIDESDITANPSSCPVTTRFFGDSRIYFDYSEMTGKFVAHVMVFSDEGIAEIVESRGDITFQDSTLSAGTFTVPETGVTYQVEIGLGIDVRPVIDGYYCEGITMNLAADGGNYWVVENIAGTSYMGIENFAIKQTKSGGFKITTTIYMVESDVPDDFVGTYDKKVAVQTTTFETTSTGLSCAKDVVDVSDGATVQPTTTVPSGRISSGGVGKPNKKNGQNPTRNGVCDSFSAFFLEYASVSLAGYTTQLAFSGEFKVYDKHGRKAKKTFQIGVISASAIEDTWRVALVDLDGADPAEAYPTGLMTAVTTEYLATRVATGTSDLSYLYLKHNELAKGGNKAFKQAQKSAGYQVGLNGQNSVKDNRIIASSFEDDFKKDKPRSWKKNTKNKKTNRRRRRRNKKAAGWRDQLGN